MGATSGIGYLVAQLVGTMALVALVAYLVLRFGAHRFQHAAKKGPVRLLARLPLEPKRSIYLIESGERAFLVGSAEAGMNLIAEVPRPDEPAPSAPAKRSP